jgi:hypothetical protein
MGLEEGANTGRFFYCELEIAERARDENWTRDELLLYLLHCRGYNHTRRASLMGEKAALCRVGLTRSRWLAARAQLERRGVVRTISAPGSKSPLTCVASAQAPYDSSLTGDGSARAIDGHRYQDLGDRQLLKLPWALIEQSADGLPTLAHLESTGSILCLASLYALSDDSGATSNLLAWVEGVAESYLVRLAEGVEELLAVNAEQFAGSSAELLDSGLVYVGVEGKGKLMAGRWQLHLCHPMRPARAAA